jgi:hypothetical protein
MVIPQNNGKLDSMKLTRSHQGPTNIFFFYGRGYYAFLFKTKDRDSIFKSMYYFMGIRGMYLNRWTPDFNPENGIPFVVQFGCGFFIFPCIVGMMKP